jgi:tetratricopeptide (TPR) repeat protein
MKRIETRAARSLAAALLSAAMMGATGPGALAQESPQPTREAAKHFERGVALYGEADYRGALVEFKRAYAIAPNAAALYNAGQSLFQLQDYAAALTTFTRFIAESSSTDAHRAEVENTLDVLRSRVGHVTIVTNPPGAEVAVDDVSVGRTPLDERVLVGVGARKITASLAGHATVTRNVEVAADDNLAVTLDLPRSSGLAKEAEHPTGWAPAADARANATRSGAGLRTAGWVATGMLAAGAGVSGGLALLESSRLRSDRASYPVSSAQLAHESTLTLTYSVAADALTAAAVVVGGITLFSTWTAPKPGPRSSTTAAITLLPNSAHFEMTF